jgi:hypothetical protein
MNRHLSQTISLLFLSVFCWGQTQPLIVPKYIRLPADSVQSGQLVASLNGFLDQASGPNKDNAFVQEGYLPETSALLDEMKGIGNAGVGKVNFYRCYLTNVALLDSSDFIIQLAWLGSIDSMPVLRASFKLIAYREGDRYYFRSPLKRNTATWRQKKTGNFIFYYNNPLNETALNAYVKKAAEFDRKLGVKEYITQFYCCNSLQEGLEMFGVDYKMDYNGYYSDNFSSFEGNISLNIMGASNSSPALFDLHDLWHDRLHHAIPVSTINRPIDEGCAYLYAGSWGLSWEEIFRQFKVYMGDNKDWLTAFNENKNFGSSQQYHLYVSYVINALLAQKIEKEKGFDAVMEFLACGKKQPGDENYFAALDRIIGINTANFNVSVEKLVEEEK